jgi:hypothetical protein
MDWVAEIQSGDIAPGALALFVQDGHVDGDPPAELAHGDQFYVVFPDNTRRAGMVTSREPLSATITVGADHWRIEPVTTAMVAAPTALPSQGWRFVEKLV